MGDVSFYQFYVVSSVGVEVVDIVGLLAGSCVAYYSHQHGHGLTIPEPLLGRKRFGPAHVIQLDGVLRRLVEQHTLTSAKVLERKPRGLMATQEERIELLSEFDGVNHYFRD